MKPNLFWFDATITWVHITFYRLEKTSFFIEILTNECSRLTQFFRIRHFVQSPSRNTRAKGRTLTGRRTMSGVITNFFWTPDIYTPDKICVQRKNKWRRPFFQRRTMSGVSDNLFWTPDIITPDKIQHLADMVKSLLSLALISYQHFPEFIATSLAAMFEGRLYGSKLDFCCREGVMGRNINAARQAGRNAPYRMGVRQKINMCSTG